MSSASTGVSRISPNQRRVSAGAESHSRSHNVAAQPESCTRGVGRLGSNPGPADYEKHARPQHAPGLQRCHALVLREHTWRWDFLRRRSTPRSTPRTLGKAAPSGAAAGVVSRVSEREYSPAANIAVCSGLPNPDAVVVISGRLSVSRPSPWQPASRRLRSRTRRLVR